MPRPAKGGGHGDHTPACLAGKLLQPHKAKAWNHDTGPAVEAHLCEVGITGRERRDSNGGGRVGPAFL